MITAKIVLSSKYEIQTFMFKILKFLEFNLNIRPFLQNSGFWIDWDIFLEGNLKKRPRSPKKYLSNYSLFRKKWFFDQNLCFFFRRFCSVIIQEHWFWNIENLSKFNLNIRFENRCYDPVTKSARKYGATVKLWNELEWESELLTIKDAN